MPQGDGYWIWKLWLIAHWLARLNENDILIYFDSGCNINVTSQSHTRFRQYIDMVNNNRCGFLRFALVNHKEKDWSNHTMFDYMARHYGVRPELAHTLQLIGGILIMRNTVFVCTLFKRAMQIIEDDPWLLTDRYTRSAEKHRHDQSLLSLLYKYMDGDLIVEDESYFYDTEGWNEKEAQLYPFHASRVGKRSLYRRIVDKIKTMFILSCLRLWDRLRKMRARPRK